MNPDKPPTVPPPSGLAPVLLHDLIHRLQTAAQTRPRPVSDKSEAMTAVPVLIDFGGLLIYPTGWRLSAGQDGGFALVIHASAPPAMPAEPEAVQVEREPAAEAVSVPWTVQGTPGVIPELAHLDPDVFRPNTDKPAGWGGREKVPNAGSAKDA